MATDLKAFLDALRPDTRRLVLALRDGPVGLAIRQAGIPKKQSESAPARVLTRSLWPVVMAPASASHGDWPTAPLALPAVPNRVGVMSVPTA